MTVRIAPLEDGDIGRAVDVLPLARLGAHGEYLVAWEDGEPVGHAFLALPNPSLRFPELPELQDVYVLPERRGRGIGAEVTAAAEREAARRGFDRLVLSVGERGPRALYERLGYRDAGVPPVRVQGTIELRTGPLEVDDTLHYLAKEL